MNIKNLKYDIIEIDNSKYINLHLNENENVVYKIEDDFNIDTLNILIEAEAYAITLLYLNEKASLDSNTIKSSINTIDKISKFYNECDNLVKERTSVVEEQGYLLDTVNKLNLMENANGIIIGNKKKLMEASRYLKQRVERINECLDNLEDDNIPLEIKTILSNYDAKKFLDTMSKSDISRAEEILYSEVDRDLYKKIPKALEENEELEEDDKIYTPDEVKAFYISKGLTEEKANKLVKDIFALTEETEGTQVEDIAPKVDQEMNKHKDLIIQKVRGIQEGVVAIGFLRNSEGLYTRGNYVLIKENNIYKAVHKNLIKD